jgi:bacterioferritin (cytochrome b1)
MKDNDLNLLDAIQIAMAAEQKAAGFYADAAQETANPLGRELFEQLVEFERHHYRKLAALEKSLRDEGGFIGYEGKELQSPALGEADGFEEAHRASVMGIISAALDVEREAEKRYGALAKRTTDPAGRSMFKRLSEEEHTHYRVLNDAYWSLNDRGVWVWSE